MDTGKAALPAGRVAGFTLLELLVAFALVALIVVLLGGGIRFGARVWETSHAEAEATDEVLAVRRFVRERVLAARPAALGGGRGDSADSGFEGGTGAFRLVTLMPSYAAPGGLYQVSFAESPAARGTTLELAWRPLGAEESGEAARRRVLLADIDEVAISYFGDPENQGNPSWHASWPGGTAQPRLISVKVAFPSGDPRAWPELIVPLPASSAPGLGDGDD